MKCTYICPVLFHCVHLTILICVDGTQAGDAELNWFALSVSSSRSTFCSQSKSPGGSWACLERLRVKRSHRVAAVVDDDKGGDADCNLSFPQYLTLLSMSPFTRGTVKAFQIHG